jgi:hypothetical protein
MTLPQKVREAMRKHGLTEIEANLYSAGDVREGKMAVVVVILEPNPTDADIQDACDGAAEAYRKEVQQ